MRSQGFLSKIVCEYVEAICNAVTPIAAAIAHTSKSSSSNQVAAIECNNHRKTAIAISYQPSPQQECDKRLPW